MRQVNNTKKVYLLGTALEEYVGSEKRIPITVACLLMNDMLLERSRPVSTSSWAQFARAEPMLMLQLMVALVIL